MSFDRERRPRYREPERKPNLLWLWILLGVGAFFGVLCCGGGIFLFQFGMEIEVAEIQERFKYHPAVVEHIGEIEDIDVSWAQSMGQDNEDIRIYPLKGTKGEGRIVIVFESGFVLEPEVLSAELEMKNGETFDLLEAEESIPD